MSDPEEHKLIQTKYEMGGRQERRADEPKWNRVIFSVPKKKRQSKCSFIAKKVVPFYTLMYAHKHSLTHTQTQSHAPSIVIRGQNMVVMFFYNCFSENVLHLFFTAENTA
ncbi:hypothetical protein PAMP_017080 [Pampus punctatissimus]